jgi:hypothetical protein
MICGLMIAEGGGQLVDVQYTYVALPAAHAAVAACLPADVLLLPACSAGA